MTKYSDLAEKIVQGLSDKEIERVISEIRKKKQNQVVWKEQNKILKQYEIQGGKKWFKVQVAENKESNEKYIRALRAGQSLSIKNEKEFTKLLTYLKTGANVLNWYDAQDVDILQNLDDYIFKNKDQKEKIDKLRNTVSGLRGRLLTMDITQFENSLKEFKNIYTTEHEEKDLQAFLQKNTWILGDEYVYQQPIFFAQFPMWKDKLDFFVRRYDEYYDIIEIKKADAELFSGLNIEEPEIISPTRRSPMAGDLKNALSQIINYLEEANLFRLQLKEINNNINIHKPRGFILIGRSDPKYNKAITTLNDYLNNIRILTYDDLYKKANELIIRIKKGSNLNS